MKRPSFAALLAVLALWVNGVVAAPLTIGNLIASVNEFTGSIFAPTYVAEYTTAGARVQTVATVPPPGGGADPTTEQARDLILGPGNAIFLYNGTFDPRLARLDLGSVTWSQQGFAGWSTVNNGTYGGIGRLGNFVFATDMATGGGVPRGIVRFDTGGGPTVRFAGSIEPIDLYVGPDGVLYALAGPPLGIHKYDPLGLGALGSVPLPSPVDHRALAVAPDGTIYVATFGGVINRFSASGALVDSLTVPGAEFADIDIDPSGRIALGTAFDGQIVITDLALDTFSRFRATDSAAGGDVFVAWVQSVPEPAPLWLVPVAGVLLLARRRGWSTLNPARWYF